MDHSLGDEATQFAGDGESLPDLIPGDVIERYHVIRLLGRGGMGQVYEVEHVELGTRHALKIIPHELAGQSGFIERFRREATVMAQLQHPGIVHVRDFACTEGRYWLQMDIVKGVPVGEGEQRAVSLADLAKASNGTLDQALLADLLAQVLEALAYAHEKGTVHRDLKPGNILLDEGEEGPKARISDFGLVRIVGEEWLRSAAQRSVSMSVGAVSTEVQEGGESTRSLLGTYAYMSPEQKTGGEVDARSDLYAIGLMTARLLTGEAELGYQLPTDLDPALSPAWNDLVRRGVHPKPEGRYQTAAEMREAVATIAEEIARSPAEGAPADEAPPAEEPVPVESKPQLTEKRKRGVFAPIAVAAVVLLVIAGVFFAVARSGGQSEQPKPKPAQTPSGPTAAAKAQALLDEAKKLHDAKEYARAVAKLDDLIYRYPETPAKVEAETLKTQCEKALAARKETEAKVKAAFARAKVQEEAGLIEEAIATLGAVLPDAPDNSRLRAEIARLRKVHHERTTAAQRAQSYRQFMDAGLAAELRRDWPSAVKAYESALANKDTAEAKRKLAAARHSVLAGKAKGEADLDKRIDLYVQDLSQENRPETRTLLAEA